MIEKLLIKLAKGLDTEGIPYMIIGGQAVLVYGIPRLTEDIDITLGVDVGELPKVLELSRHLKLKRFKKADNEFVKKTNVLVCEDLSTGIRIDFIFSFLDYERQAIKRARKINLRGYKIKFASCEDLIIHKMFAGRLRDLEDVKGILGKIKGSVDVRYINKWLMEFSKMPESSDVQKKWLQLLEQNK